MIDFNQNTFFKLRAADAEKGKKLTEELLIPGEQVLAAYRDVRDWVVFTDRRIISVNVESVTGKKKNFTSLPYATVSAFSVETAGVLDIDSRMELWFSGLGRVRFEFTGGSDTVAISRMIANYSLRCHGGQRGFGR